MSPGLKTPNKDDAIAWVPLTSWSLTAAFSASKTSAKILSIISLPKSPWPYPVRDAKCWTFKWALEKAFNTFSNLNETLSVFSLIDNYNLSSILSTKSFVLELEFKDN